MTNNDLAASVAALKDGDRVRATFVNGETEAVYTGPVKVGRRDARVWIAEGEVIRWAHGHLASDLTAVEVLTPTLPPEPPVGSGVFHDGVLWWRDSFTGKWFASGDLGRDVAVWSEIQPCVPAVPAGGE